MSQKTWLKIVAGLFINLSASWFAAVFILPNFDSIKMGVYDLITSVANGTLLLTLTYFIEIEYAKY